MKLFQKLVCMALTATATASLSICAFAADYTFDTAADTDYYPSTSYEDTYGTAYHYGSKNLVDYQIPELPYGVLSTTQTGVMEKLRLPGLQQTVGGSASGIYGVDSGVGIPAVTPVISSYADTMQAKAMKLMASKLAVAGIIEGTFSEEGLAAMSDVKDLTSQMAKELALGIRDNVEDIAAAFRKMAVMNPERKKNIAAAQLKETAAEEQKAPAAKDSFGVRTAQAQVRQALYEGLLARTAEEQKKRKSKKAEVDENQLSIFGFAA